jgi:hypothetical protein
LRDQTLYLWASGSSALAMSLLGALICIDLPWGRTAALRVNGVTADQYTTAPIGGGQCRD